MRENERNLKLEEEIIEVLNIEGESSAAAIWQSMHVDTGYTVQQVKKSLAHLMIKGIVVATWNKGLFYSIYKEKETEE